MLSRKTDFIKIGNFSRFISTRVRFLIEKDSSGFDFPKFRVVLRPAENITEVLTGWKHH